MAYVLIKRGRYMAGHSYSSLHGYSFMWSATEAEAIRFSDNDPSVDVISRVSGAKIVHTQNTRQEIKALARAAPGGNHG